MTTQLPLFREPPPWWTAADADVCRDYRAQAARDYPPGLNADPDTMTDADHAALDAWCDTLHPRAAGYTCRRCAHWTSGDGRTGVCEAMVERWRDDYEGTRDGRYEPEFGMTDR